MEALIELMWTLISVTIVFLVPFVMIVVYLIKRNGFYTNVNCWFCNTWTKVFYTDRNSFNCPTCLQYNGFKEDGDYNKVIEAQYDIPSNKYNKTLQKTVFTANSLCTYCNNNQQLKIYQLANFVPLNDNNYDVEVDHFKKQLEKGYKLCKTCEHLLKTTIEKQQAWIFENHLKSSQNKNLNSVDIPTKPRTAIKRIYWFCLSLIKFMIILCLIVIISQTLDINVDNLRNRFNMPTTFIPYLLLFKDIYNQVMETLATVTKYLNEQDFYFLKQVKFNTNSKLHLASLGFLLQIIFTSCDQRHTWWKLNQLLGWILLNVTSLIPSDHFYFSHIKLLQAFCSAAIMWSLLSRKTLEVNTRKKRGFKKFPKSLDNMDELGKNSNTKSNRNKMHQCKKYMTDNSPHFLFKNKVQMGNNQNNSFSTARSNKTASVLNRSEHTNSELSLNSDLSSSLDNLHLGSPKLPACTSPVFSVSSTNRPILSPSKLKNITQNSWTAGGFWKNDSVFPISTNLSPGFTNLSRSSSQTSGFISNGESVTANMFNSPPPSRDPSVCGDYEKTSVFSEPSYHFQPINSSDLGNYQSANVFPNHVLQSPDLLVTPNCNTLYYKATNNVFYPVLNQNSMLLIQAPNRSNNFDNLSNVSLRNFNMGSNRVNSVPLFENQPVVSSLFKNISSIHPQSDNFKVPQC